MGFGYVGWIDRHARTVNVMMNAMMLMAAMWHTSTVLAHRGDECNKEKKERKKKNNG